MLLVTCSGSRRANKMWEIRVGVPTVLFSRCGNTSLFSYHNHLLTELVVHPPHDVDDINSDDDDDDGDDHTLSHLLAFLPILQHPSILITSARHRLSNVIRTCRFAASQYLKIYQQRR